MAITAKQALEIVHAILDGIDLPSRCPIWADLMPRPLLFLGYTWAEHS